MLEDVCVHRAIPYKRKKGGTWVEGRYVDAVDSDQGGTGFDCVLFLPQPGGEDTQTGTPWSRRVTSPTLLYLPDDDEGSYVALSAEDELGVIAPELNVAQGRPEGYEERWAVRGDPQPLGRPGDDVLGFQAILTKVGE